jgi:acyl-CoA thioesterase FadM
VYERAAVFDDVLTIGVRCAEIRGARFRFEYLVEREDERVAHGWTAHATVDRATHRPTRVPEWFVEDVLRAEASTRTP